MPFFSIIVTVYKVEKYLNECIQSILSQSFGDCECILVDDGSPDNCPIMCDEYAKKYEQIKTIHKENGGLSDARNVGILQASGEYIVLLDGDDKFADNNALKNLFNVIQKNKTDVIVNVNWLKFADNGEKIFCNNYNKNISLVAPKEIAYNFEKSSMTMAGWLFVLKKEYLVKNDLFFKKGILHEDIHWMPRVLFRTQLIAINHLPFYAYRILVENSITAVINAKRLYDLLDIIYNLFEWSGDRIYTEDGRNYMIRLTNKIYRYICDLAVKIKPRDKKNYQEICKILPKRLKKTFRYSKSKLNIIIIILGFDKAMVLQQLYSKLKKNIKRFKKDSCKTEEKICLKKS